jgi:hypothetical protein
MVLGLTVHPFHQTLNGPQLPHRKAGKRNADENQHAKPAVKPAPDPKVAG